MNLLREIASNLAKMFIGDAWLAAGILVVVGMAALLTSSGIARGLLGGALLLFGCIVVLSGSVALHCRRSNQLHARNCDYS